MDDRLRIRLWNAMHKDLFAKFSFRLGEPGERDFFLVLWDFLGWSTDTVSMYNREVNERVLRDYLFKNAQWDQVYDVVEKAVELTFWPIDSDDLLRAFNGVLEAEVSGLSIHRKQDSSHFFRARSLNNRGGARSSFAHKAGQCTSCALSSNVGGS